MSTTQEEVEEFLQTYRGSDFVHRGTMRTIALFEGLKWQEIKKGIREIDLEEDD